MKKLSIRMTTYAAKSVANKSIRRNFVSTRGLAPELNER